MLLALLLLLHAAHVGGEGFDVCATHLQFKLNVFGEGRGVPWQAGGERGVSVLRWQIAGVGDGGGDIRDGVILVGWEVVDGPGEHVHLFLESCLDRGDHLLSARVGSGIG